MHRVRFSLALLVTWALAACVFAESRMDQALLALAQRGAPPWYERLVRFTNWPQQPTLPEVREVPYLRYSYEVLLKQVIRDGVLDAGWQDKVVRVPAWIPRMPGMVAADLDGYLYRQPFQGGTLHICDTRPTLNVTFAGGGTEDFLEQPQKSVAKLGLFKVLLPEGTEWTFDEATGLATGHAFFSVSDRGIEAAGRRLPPDTNASAFSLFCCVAKHIVVCEFDKFYVPGCELTSNVPLFRPASAKPTDVEEAIAFFDGLEAPTPADIPRMTEVLKSLPTIGSMDQALRPYEFRLLSQAKYSGYEKLIAAMEAIEPERKDAAALLRDALAARPSERDLRSLAQKIEKAAIQVGRKGTEGEMDAILKEVADTGHAEWVVEDALEATLAKLPEHEARRRCLEQLEELGRNPDAAPRTVVVCLRRLGPEDHWVEEGLVRNVLRKTTNDQVRDECLRVLARWLIQPSEARDDALHTLRERVADADPRVRSQVASAFGRSGDVRRLPVLATMLDDPAPSVRGQAAQAVCELLGWERATSAGEKEAAAYQADLRERLKPVLEALTKFEEAAAQQHPPAPAPAPAE